MSRPDVGPRSFVSDDDLASIARGLADRTLPKAEWTHAAHFAAALWLVAERGAGAAQELPRLIRAYNEAVGVPNTDSSGYHETITLASLGAVRARLAAAAPGTPLAAVLRDLLSSELGRSDWVLRYWSKARLYSAEARRAWAEPDVQPLPFKVV